MRILNFSQRCFKEIIRDPLSIIFAILLPLFLLFIFQQFEIPNEVYSIHNFTPGIIIFGFSFITLFTATLVAKDRSTALLTRLCASPMKPYDYILGYAVSVLPVVFLQNLLFFITAVILGLKFSINIVYTILAAMLLSVLFIMLGIFIGSVTNEKSASGISSLVVQLVAFTSGMYFSNEMVGKGFAAVCDILPFSACLNITKGILNGDTNNLTKAAIIFIAYTLASAAAAVYIFNQKMKKS